ncbi:Lrp/AsnC family transcriptional regulator [Sulfitobacter sp. M57]|uniref:Lrp/AsnC family transcriptional regulator n=1 Tax=unclassified Sulfitobacter TaxID=196795 RepID=UPI0023E19B16|nr:MULTISPECIES: Lrp/AsnC family transcriptional regulator [unclassified Sulfitobacter]MDF3416522.1 Lrp/AsnC family transcriptional regulator [Sulfitobacter sp. KE5]MDF3424038.1 Lrp/AsnC family transcriptional regulator [Sulfitobacter sp. KE43]MDF3435024.1 Lrp/AsnC family transcriptional regulator [Sulfitobacter sp. KE42]MDF3460657.1 Lrp/AsnC family transcriptional regulator [Sulfitobacter sp. S74]MDF3464611.1 Lrp/AsnC family transcriptional regulator [Sulfitobacter sp. Ks18]
MPQLDAIDRKIIRTLQKNGRMTNLDLAAEVNLSPSPCLRRLRLLEQSKAITGYSVDVDARAYGLPVTVMVRISLEKHTKDVVDHFEEQMKRIPEVLECFVMTGLSDYMLRVVVSDLEGYERFVRDRLQSIGGIGSIDSSFVYGVVKRTHVFPEISGHNM